MTALSRRSLLAGAAALTVAGSVNAPVRAAAPMAGKQGPSFYRYKIGEFEVTTLNEGVVRNATTWRSTRPCPTYRRRSATHSCRPTTPSTSSTS